MNRRTLRTHKILALVAAPVCMTHPGRAARVHADAFDAATAASSLAETSQGAILPVTDDQGYPLVGNVTAKVPDSMVQR